MLDKSYIIIIGILVIVFIAIVAYFTMKPKHYKFRIEGSAPKKKSHIKIIIIII